MDQIQYTKDHIHQKKLYLIAISMAIFVISIFLQPYYVESMWHGEDGYRPNTVSLFYLGWIYLFRNLAFVSWLANPLIIASWICLYKKPKLACILSVLASLAALAFILTSKGAIAPTDEAGFYSEITKLGAGYWSWCLSIVLFTVGSCYFLYLDRHLNK